MRYTYIVVQGEFHSIPFHSIATTNVQKIFDSMYQVLLANTNGCNLHCVVDQPSVLQLAICLAFPCKLRHGHQLCTLIIVLCWSQLQGLSFSPPHPKQLSLSGCPNHFPSAPFSSLVWFRCSIWSPLYCSNPRSWEFKQLLKRFAGAQQSLTKSYVVGYIYILYLFIMPFLVWIN